MLEGLGLLCRIEVSARFQLALLGIEVVVLVAFASLALVKTDTGDASRDRSNRRVLVQPVRHRVLVESDRWGAAGRLHLLGVGHGRGSGQTLRPLTLQWCSALGRSQRLPSQHPGQIGCPWGGHHHRMPQTPDPTAGAQGPDVRFGGRAVLAAIALTLLAVPFGLLLFLVQDKWPPLLRVDLGARDDLYTYALGHRWFVAAVKLLSTAGSSLVYLLVFAVVVGWLVRQGRVRLAVFVVVTMVGNTLLNTVVKLFVDRTRPVLPNPVAHANGLSFPSGHAQAAVVAYSVLLLVFLPGLRGPWRRLVILLAVVMVLGIGFSRVALGVHYASDVLAGYVLGAAWVAAMTAAFGAWRRERGRPEIEPTRGLPAD